MAPVAAHPFEDPRDPGSFDEGERLGMANRSHCEQPYLRKLRYSVVAQDGALL
ncbi:hypothetical protein UY3_04155 [Chelonia mydas]|uniref:Uncharacterized protein n=1 Tax=Chelonia mydas TaxID=8469 RepID=M7BN17_CHEMY|nr:hypothetical protein UY3_04155 [Chelonia mydas]